MFPRVIPEVNEEEILKILKKKKKEKKECKEMYFNSGRAALKFILQLKFKNKRIGIQNFNCNVVEDAIIESGNIPIYLDINKTFFSVSLKNIEHIKIDVLIISHLFGIPNNEYLRIRDYCQKNNIYIIDDLAQTVKATINNKEIEEYSNCYIYSFAFDKPISLNRGGLLKIKDEKSDYIYDKYLELKEISNYKMRTNIKLLYIYTKLLKRYKFNVARTNSILEQTLINLIPLDLLRNDKIINYMYKTKFNIILAKLENKCLRIKKEIEIRKLSIIEKEYLEEKIKLYTVKDKEEIIKKANEFLKNIEKKVEIKIKYPNVSISYGVRFPIVVDNQQDIINKILKKGIEVGNHNWSKVLNENIDTPSAKEIVNKIINIPIWSEEIWK